MSDNLYCDPCQRFIRGDINVTIDGYNTVEWNHHESFESFQKAIQLRCLICMLAWHRASLRPAAESNWEVGMQGEYYYDNEDWDDYRSLTFWFREDGIRRQTSETLVFRAYPISSKIKIAESISSNTGADSALAFAVDKYHRCRGLHTSCKIPQILKSAFYPSRLLDVGTELLDPIVVRDTQSFRTEEYACLSHCWGSYKPLTLNATTRSALQSGIHADELPKTFQDAVLVTRRLGIRYLWIDSLCILQDDRDDWASESSRMGSVYANAAFTIAATAGVDSRCGLFVERCPESLLPHRGNFQFGPTMRGRQGYRKDVEFPLRGTYLCDISHRVLVGIESAPLNERAWASQERQLSRRILHFTETQIFWECCKDYSSEIYPDGLPLWTRALWAFDATKLKAELSRIIEQSANDTPKPFGSLGMKRSMSYGTYFAWLTYRDQYSGFALTNPNDKLVAIHGITEWVTKLTGERFIAGLCEDHIEEELCWDEKRELPLTEPDTRPTKWRAPTWSWACTDCPVLLSQLTKRHGGHASRRIEAECVKKHVTGKVSGELESATIELKCKLVPATITELALWSSRDMVLRLFDQDGDVASRKLTHRFRRGEVQTFCEVFYLEKAKIDKESHERQSSTDGYVVLIQHCVHSQDSAMPRSPDVSENEEETDSESEEEPYEKDSAEALFLQAHGDNTFAKVGLLCFDGDLGVKQILEAHRLAEERVITLI